MDPEICEHGIVIPCFYCGDKPELAIKLLLTELTNEERVALFSKITADYCRHCGTDRLPCRCWDDT